MARKHFNRSIAMAPGMKEELERVAKLQGHTVSSLVRVILRDWLEADINKTKT